MCAEMRSSNFEKRNKSEERKRKFKILIGSFWILSFVFSICLGFGLSNFGFCATPAPTTNRTSEISCWFTDLADRDAAKRDAARQNLMGLSRDDLPILQSLVKNTRPLAPSQAEALHDIVMQVYLAGDIYPARDPSGFLGVRFQTYVSQIADVGEDETPQGIVVTDRIPGFPGYQSLQNGDVIMSATELGSEAIGKPEEFSKMIASFKDGEMVHLNVLRAGKMMTISVKVVSRPIWVNTQIPTEAEALRQNDHLRQRLERAETYWETNFATSVDDSIS